MTLLQCHDLSKTYDNGVRALQGVTLAVQPGEFVCVTGRSGSGKTTLLNCLGTLDKPTGGAVLFDGKNIHEFSAKEVLEFRRRSLGFIFQEFHLVPFLSAVENAALPLVYQGLSWRKALAEAEKILEEMGVSSKRAQTARTLSGGESQRVAIGRAVIGKPKFLLADEPTGELDSATAQTIVELLKAQKQKGTAILAVSHDPAVMSAAGRTLTLFDGKIIRK